MLSFQLIPSVGLESALSIRIMLETDNIDLSEGFEIKLVECDCELDFPGYSVQNVHGANGQAHLVRKQSQLVLFVYLSFYLPNMSLSHASLICQSGTVPILISVRIQ
jgi:hypothetical protein